MRKCLIALAAAATVMFSYAAPAQGPADSAKASSNFSVGLSASSSTAAPTLDDIKKAVPEFSNPKTITATPIAGMYQVQSDEQIMYITGDMKYAFSGRLMDIANKKDMTEPLLRQMAMNKFERDQAAAEMMQGTVAKALADNQKNFIKEVKGNGKDVLYMVTDARCGFCQRMESNLDKLTDVTIYRIPVAYLGPDSLAQGNAAWCAKDKLQAWKDISVRHTPIAKAGDCVSPVEENTEMAKSWNIRGTPSFFKADGQRWVRGLISADIAKVFYQKGTQAAITAQETEMQNTRK